MPMRFKLSQLNISRFSAIVNAKSDFNENAAKTKNADFGFAGSIERKKPKDAALILDQDAISGYEVSKIFSSMDKVRTVSIIQFMRIEKVALAIGHGGLSNDDIACLMADAGLLPKTAAQILSHNNVPSVVFAGAMANEKMPIDRAVYCFNYGDMPMEKIKAAVEYRVRHREKDKGMTPEHLMQIFASDSMRACRIAEIIAFKDIDLFDIMSALSVKRELGVKSGKIIEVPPEKIADALGNEIVPSDRAAWILNHRNMPIDKTAAILDNMEAQRAALIFTSSNKDDSKNMDHHRIQKIILSKNLSTYNFLAIRKLVSNIDSGIQLDPAKPDKKEPSELPEFLNPDRKQTKRLTLKQQILTSEEMDRHFAGISDWRNMPIEYLKKVFDEINNKK